MQDIIMVGYGGHGRSVADTIEKLQCYHILGYTDIQESQDATYPYLGTDQILIGNIYDKKSVKLAMGLGYMGHGNIRRELFRQLMELGYEFPTLIDSSAIVSNTARIDDGAFVGKGAIIGAEAKIGQGAIINSGAIVEHECCIGEGTHIAVGATLCGQVSIGNFSLVGANATVNQGIKIGGRSIIGAGAVVINDIDDNVVAVGVPTKVIKKNER